MNARVYLQNEDRKIMKSNNNNMNKATSKIQLQYQLLLIELLREFKLFKPTSSVIITNTTNNNATVVDGVYGIKKEPLADEISITTNYTVQNINCGDGDGDGDVIGNSTTTASALWTRYYINMYINTFLHII